MNRLCKIAEALFLIVIVVVSLTSCSHSDSFMPGLQTNNRSFDSQRGFVRYDSRFAKNDRIVYFENTSSLLGRQADLVMFCDLDKEIVAPLCGKAECTHDSADCNAFIGSRSEGNGVIPISLIFYDGRLYNLMARADESEGPGIYLISSSPDGSNRRKEMKLGDYMEDLFPSENTKTLMHRGYVFSCGGASFISDGEWKQREILVSWSLETKEKTILFEWVDPIPGRMTYSYIQAYEDNLYYFIVTPIGDTPGENAGYSLTIRRWDMDTMSEEILFSGNIENEIWEIWASDQEIWFSDNKGNVYAFDLTAREIRSCFSFQDGDVWTDRVFFFDELAYAVTSDNNEDLYFTVMDFNGKTLVRKLISDKMSMGRYIKTVCGADEENAYIYYTAVGENAEKLGYTYKLVSYRIKDGEETILWLAK